MKPKSRKEILDICQDNFLSYSTLNKVAIIIAVLLSAGSLALYLCKFILPTIKGIICSEIGNLDIIKEVFKIIHSVVTNVTKNPTEEKYRKINI